MSPFHDIHLFQVFNGFIHRWLNLIVGISQPIHFPQYLLGKKKKSILVVRKSNHFKIFSHNIRAIMAKIGKN